MASNLGKFIEIVGTASTSAWLNGKCIGHNVNASAYYGEDGTSVVMVLESNSSPVYAASRCTFSDMEAYRDYCDANIGTPLFVAAIESCGAAVR